MIPSIDKVYLHKGKLFNFCNAVIQESKKKADKKTPPVQIPPSAMYSLYIQGLLYLCRDKNTQALQQGVVLQVVFVQA